MSTTATLSAIYQVEGMTCSHCARSVSQEIGALPGVCDVTVDLSTGQVTVCSDREMTRAEISAAVDEAGYQLAS